MLTSREQAKTDAATAKELYLNTRVASDGAEDWRFALKEARHDIADALRASNHLRDLANALCKNGKHMLAFRHLMAPPISQDQFKLISKSWPKASEKSGQPVSKICAVEAAATFEKWRDRHLTRWLEAGRKPTRAEIRQLLTAISPIMASQRFGTSRRNRLAAVQEQSIVNLLLDSGWTKIPSMLIDTRAALPEKSFQHKTRFATNTTAPQEVDIACGLKGTIVLAIECKVTNDETNSVKRINDVLKKSSAWRAHWGSFVKTAALLQGVINVKDVQRLLDDDVLVFWSHNLEAFSNWVQSQV